jgi:hypothetical protein
LVQRRRKEIRLFRVSKGLGGERWRVFPQLKPCLMIVETIDVSFIFQRASLQKKNNTIVSLENRRIETNLVPIFPN